MTAPVELLLMITPHKDGVRCCQNCQQFAHTLTEFDWCRLNRENLKPRSNPKRTRFCLAAARAARELREEIARLREIAVLANDMIRLMNEGKPVPTVWFEERIRAALKGGGR